MTGQFILALRHVASRANLAWFGAHEAPDEIEEIDEARDEREELSEIIDSGEEEVEGAVAPDPRRENWYAERPKGFGAAPH